MNKLKIFKDNKIRLLVLFCLISPLSYSQEIKNPGPIYQKALNDRKFVGAIMGNSSSLCPETLLLRDKTDSIYNLTFNGELLPFSKYSFTDDCLKINFNIEKFKGKKYKLTVNAISERSRLKKVKTGGVPVHGNYLNEIQYKCSFYIKNDLYIIKKVYKIIESGKYVDSILIR
jgi:hypothetical protein